MSAKTNSSNAPVIQHNHKQTTDLASMKKKQQNKEIIKPTEKRGKFDDFPIIGS